MIWYSDNEDGFLLLKQKLLMFVSVDEAKSFAEKQGVLLEAEITVYDFSNVIGLINRIESSESCNMLTNAWNFFSDLAKSLKEDFIGDSNEGLTIDIYNKLFYGSNLNVLKKDDEDYHPIFDDEETKKCMSIYYNGLSLLDKQFDVLDIQ